MLPTNLIDTLMCLNDDEWKYLPLWAGGNDDGTGGVFDEVDVPNLEAGGFRGGKRGIGHVRNGASSSASGSSFDDIASEAISTVGKASKAATDGTQTVQSISSVRGKEESFMRQNELWTELQKMKDDGERPVDYGNGDIKGKGVLRAFIDDSDMMEDEDEDEDDEEGEVDTVLGGASDDGQEEDMPPLMDMTEKMPELQGLHFSVNGNSPIDYPFDGAFDDEDMEVVNKHDL